MQQGTVRYKNHNSNFVRVALHSELHYKTIISPYKNCRLTVTKIYGLYFLKIICALRS